MIGVVYKFQPYNKINGTLFYCFEYACFLNAPLYLVNITDKDLRLVKNILKTKYTTPPTNLIPISLTQLYAVKLEQTLVLDMKTFNSCKEFLTNNVHVFSNEPHDMFRYKNERTVTYYGSYPDYQNFDVFNYLKLNFDIFKQIETTGDGVFVSSVRVRDDYVHTGTNKPVILKRHDQGVGNLFELVDTVHYLHTQRDTNNRIIPEGFYYGKKVIIEDDRPDIIDSVTLRYNDIVENGLKNYTLTHNDEMVKACLGYAS